MPLFNNNNNGDWFDEYSIPIKQKNLSDVSPGRLYVCNKRI